VPAWIFFTAAVLLTVVCLLALGFARAHVEAEGGGGAFQAYLPAALIGAGALALALLGCWRLGARRRSPGRLEALFVVGCLGFGFVAAATDAVENSPNGVFFAPWLMLALLVFALVITVLTWRRLDEAAREAHKWSWYWGATVGMTLAVPLFFFGAQSAAIRGGLGLENSFVTGALTVLALQITGYGVAWGYWWLRRR
jgi:hypothetical protein